MILIEEQVEKGKIISEKIKIENKNIFYKTALGLIESGYSIVPAKGKIPLGQWKKYQNEIADEKIINNWFIGQGSESIAIVCGKISGGLEVIDIDLKYDTTGNLYERIKEEIERNIPTLFPKLRVIETFSGGYHLYYRSEFYESNQKLANRESNSEEKKANANDKIKALIETRGQGGVVIAPPSQGYLVIQDNKPPFVSEDERDTLLSLLRAFNEVFETESEIKEKATFEGLRPGDDFNQRVDFDAFMRSKGWEFIYASGDNRNYRRPGKLDGISGGYNQKLNLFHSFSTSTPFDTTKGYSPFAVYTLLEHNGDYNTAAKELSKIGYGEKTENINPAIKKTLDNSKQKGLPTDEIVRELIYHHKISEAEANRIVSKSQLYTGPDICKFWTIDKKNTIAISYERLIKFLNEEGFFRFDLGSNNSKLIRFKNNIIHEAKKQEVKDCVLNYINQLPSHFDKGKTQSDLLEVILRGANTYFHESQFEFLPLLNKKLLQDELDKSYLPFLNGVVEISKNSIRLINYNEIDLIIWENQVINHNIKLSNAGDEYDCEYLEFLNCISNRENERLFMAISLIGYELHRFKADSSSKVLVLAEETENDISGGGAGKGIFVKALSKLRPIVTINGKSFNPDKSFVYSRVTPYTCNLFIDDINRDFKFEKLNSIITEGIDIEKKNEDEIRIENNESPKVILSTNYTIPSISGHSKRRIITLEFSSFFNHQHTPVDHFKHELFRDWDNCEWNKFFNLMLYCIKNYLENGFMNIDPTLTIKRKQIKNHYSEQFLEWWDLYSKDNKGKWMLSSDLYNDFLNTSELTSRDFSTKRFRKALEQTAIILGLKFEHNISSNHKKEYCITESNS